MNIDWLIALVNAWQAANLDNKIVAGTSFALALSVAVFLCYYVPRETAELKAAKEQIELCITKMNK